MPKHRAATAQKTAISRKTAIRAEDPSVEPRRAARGAEAPQEQSERDRPLSKVGSPPEHARADVARPDRDRQRDKWSVLNKEIERIRRAFTFDSRLPADTSDTRFNLAGGALSRACRYAFHVLNQACDVTLHRVKILAKQRKIGICVH